MQKVYEIIDFSEQIPVKCFIHKLGYSPRHWHESIELLYVLSGKADITVNNKKHHLETEDIILINSNEIHELSGEECVVIAIQIKLSKFDIGISENETILFDCNSSRFQDKTLYNPLKRIIARFIKANASSDENKDIMNKALVYFLIYELIRQFKVHDASESSIPSQKYLERLTRILDYIHDNFKEDISLSKLAENEHLSIPYLSKFFSKNMNTNFVSYVNRLRLNDAVNKLLTSDESVETIAYKSGFPNPRAFSQLFKKEYQMLPSLYRKEHNFSPQKEKKNSNISQNDYEILEHRDYLGILANYLKEDLPIPERSKTKIVSKEIDALLSEKDLKHTFKTFTSVGKAKEILYAEVQDMLKIIQKEVGFEYIKFHGIFSDELFVYRETENGEVIPNFTLVDKVLDFLESINLKPLIQLSFMPEDLAKHPDKKVFHSSFITSEPKSMEKWVYLVEHFTHHLLQRYGKANVEKWKFCVWNEPDTSQQMFGMSSDEIFYNFYKETYRAIKDINPHLEFGTPATYFTAWDDSNWLVRFTEWCRENDCVADFINIHFYGTELTNNITEELVSGKPQTLKLTLSENENSFHKFVDVIQNYNRSAYPKGTPIYLTEWNYTPSHFDLIGDTCYKACYIIKNILENYDLLDSFGYWVLTDFFEEYSIPEEIFHGGLGLFTYNGVKKPGYYAFSLLNKLGNIFVDSGDGYFVTRSDDNYQIMFYNYKHFSSLYANGEYFDTTFLKRYTPFGFEEQKKFLISLNNLPGKNYQVTEYIVNKDYGSSFDKWLEMGAQPLNKDEVETLKALSQPMIKKYCIATNDTQLEVSATLEQLEIRLLILEAKNSNDY